jgi:hypothetical protein
MVATVNLVRLFVLASYRSYSIGADVCLDMFYHTYIVGRLLKIRSLVRRVSPIFIQCGHYFLYKYLHIFVGDYNPRMAGSVDNNVFSFDKEKEASNTLFAIPKKGRLYEKCMKLLEGAGLEHNRPPRLDVAHCVNLPLTLVFLPAADIATYVAEGNVDIGITGIDVVQEADEDVDTILVSANNI